MSLVSNFHSFSFSKTQDHNHVQDTELINASSVVQAMRDDINEDPTRPIKRTYDEVVHRNMDVFEEEEVPEFHSLRSTLQRTRSKLLPEEHAPSTMLLLRVTGGTHGQAITSAAIWIMTGVF